MDEKHDSKMIRFENYASFAVMVENLQFMVQKTSILSKDLNEDIFEYKFLALFCLIYKYNGSLKKFDFL